MKCEFDLLRSWLFVPGDSPRKLEKCWQVDADAVVIDLEDAVGEANKIEARNLASHALANLDRRGSRAFVRLSAASGARAFDDIAATFSAQPDGYVMPKVESVAQIEAVAAEIDRLEAENAMPSGSIRLVPIVTETPTAVLRLSELCRASARNSAVIWGSEDLSAELGARRVKRDDGTLLDVFRFVRSHTLISAAAAGVVAIDTPVVEIDDLERLRLESDEAAASGFTGKLAMHPGQVPIINGAFLPSADELQWARELLEKSKDGAGGVFRFGAQMVDLPHFRRAKRLMRLSEAHMHSER